jgi:antitoxin (DNA-binding transcriptional repressor) of toxin-antitoxin stability system
MAAPNPLALSLLAPAFAGAGLLLASIPIIIHILNRRRYRTVDWAAMAFLMRAMRKNRQRVRFEQWLLLAARCLVLALLGLALARPLLKDNASLGALGGRTGMHVFVIDNSYSMSYLAGRQGGKTHLDQAKILAGQMIDKLSSGESVVIITAGKPVAGVIGKPTYDLQQARAILNRIPQSYGATDLPAALRLAVEVGRENERQPNKNLYLFTDATASAWQGPDAAALKNEGQELARLYPQISHSNMATGPQWNQAVLDVHPSANLITTNSLFSSDFIASVKGFGSPHDGTLQWKMDGQLLAGGGKLQLTTDTQPQTEGQTNLQIALKSGGAGAGGGVHSITASIVGDDGLQIDNTRARIINVVSQLKTLIVEGQHGVGAEGGSGLNLQVALTGLSKSGQMEGFAAPDLISDLELGNHVLTDYRAVMLCGVSQVTPAEADQLQTFVSNGGTLMIFLADAVVPENYNTVLLPRHLIPGPLTKRVIAPDGSFFYFDFNPNAVLHPLLKAFEHQEKTGLETAQAFGYWQVDVPNDPQLRVLNWKAPEGARTDANTRPDPAITAQSLGQGRIVFVTTSANEEWITFTRKPVYTELVNELLSGSVNAGDGWMNLNVGDSLSVPSTLKLTTTPTLNDPKSVAIPLELTTAPDGSASYHSPPLLQPGVYSLVTGTGSLPIAVNVPAAEEADVHTIDDKAIRTALGGIEIQMGNDQPIAALTESTKTADAGWTVMICVLALVGFESFLAMMFGHYRKQQQPAAVAA